MTSAFAKPFFLGAVIALASVIAIVTAAPILTRFLMGGPSLIYNCQNVIPATPTSFRSWGFVTSHPTGFGPYGTQFVIRPNSTALLEITYSHFREGESAAQGFYADNAKYITPVRSWANIASRSPPIHIYNSTEIGLWATPINTALTDNMSSLTATYQVSASATALTGPYVGDFFSTCGPDIVLTVGSGLYTGQGLGGVWN